jgi:hypothetical protein
MGKKAMSFGGALRGICAWRSLFAEDSVSFNEHNEE